MQKYTLYLAVTISIPEPRVAWLFCFFSASQSQLVVGIQRIKLKSLGTVYVFTFHILFQRNEDIITEVKKWMTG